MRASVLAARARRPRPEREAVGHALATHGLPAWSGRRIVAAFASFGSEPPTGPLLAGLREAGVRVLLPVVDGRSLDWVDGDERLGVTAVEAAEVVVVPALAVDRAGNRLGRGRGYYDRALRTVTAPVIAVGYDEELVDRVPVEPHDRRVDGFLSPAGLVWFG